MTASTIRLLTRLALIPGLAVAMILASLALATPVQAKKIRADFFGMHDSQIASGSVPTVKLGSIRLWDTGTMWWQIEKEGLLPGSYYYDWSAVDRAVATAESAGLRPMLVLGQTPKFWAKNPGSPGLYGDGTTSMPNLDAWKRYVFAAAQRYGNRVEYQIWNEPNISLFWRGTVKQMAKLTATASAQINKVIGKKKATVVAPSFVLRLGYLQKWYKKYWAAKINRKSMASYVDVVSVNLYPSAKAGPEAQMPLLGFAKRALPKAARSKPMWNTEINYGLRGGPAAKRISEAKQAAYVARTLLLNAASPIRRVYWYAWAQGAIANTHLVKDDRVTRTRAGRAWQVSHGWLAGTNMKNCKKASKGRLAGVYTCTARESRTEVRRFYWKPSGKAVNVTTPKSTRSWTPLSGDTKKRKGRFQIKVGKSPVMVTSRR